MSKAKSSLLFLTQTLNDLKLNVRYLLEESFKYTNDQLYIYINPLSEGHRQKKLVESVSLSADRYQLKLILNQFYQSSLSLNPNINVTCLLHNVHNTIDLSNNQRFRDNLLKPTNGFKYDMILTDLMNANSDELKKFCLKYIPFRDSAKYLNNLEDIPLCSVYRSNVSSQPENTSNPTKDDLIAAKTSYKNSIVAGTFDRLHIGHKILLTESALLTENHLLVGITDGVMLAKKKLNDLIQSLELRTENVKRFLNISAPFIDVQPVPIYDPYGPSITEKDYQCIIVSKETASGGASVNKKRLENNLPEMDVHVVDLVGDNDQDMNNKEFDTKVSSSNERIRSLGTLIKPPYKGYVSGQPYVIGLTGGMASGKSAIRGDLEKLGAATIDCDKLGHQSYEKGRPAYLKIIEAFGKDVLDSNEEIDRAKLRNLIKDPAKYSILTHDIVWPEIKSLLLAKIDELFKSGNKIIVVEAALLIDAKWHESMNECWVCFVPHDEAISRALKRNPNLTQEEAEKLFSNQISNRERLSYANVAFCSLWEREVTQKQVYKAWDSLTKRTNI